MVLDIALGIVLAVVILWALPLLVAAGLVMVLLGIALVVIGLAFSNWKAVVTWGLVAVAIGMSFGIPYFVFRQLCRRVPRFQGLVDGKPPFDRWPYLPLRLVTVFILAVGLVCAGFGALTLTIGQIENLETWLSTKPNNLVDALSGSPK